MAWCQLYGHFHLRDEATASSIFLWRMGAKEWKCKAISELLVTIAKWEALGREYQTRTGVEALNAVSKLELLKKMLPDELRRFMEIQTIFKSDLTYDQVKAVMADLVQRTAGEGPAPMDTSSFETTGKGKGNDEQAALWQEQAWPAEQQDW